MSITDETKDYLGRIVVPLIVSLIVGAGGAWIGVKVALAQHGEKIDQNAAAIERVESRMEERHAQRRAERDLVIEVRTALSGLNSRLDRIESRLDKE